MLDTRRLKQRFAALWERAGLQGDFEETWQKLDELHSEPHRKYHNWNHIDALLKELDLAEDRGDMPENYNEIELAIFTHDAIYVIGDGQQHNEQKSAELAYEISQGSGLDSDVVKELVLITKPKYRKPETETEKLFADMDLSILGKSGLAYMVYTSQLRMEFDIYPDEVFKPGRKNVMHSFIYEKDDGDKPIYHTDYYKETHEEQARHNIKNEIKELEQQLRSK